MTFTAMLVLAGCVSQQKYDALEARYQQLNRTMSSEIAANQMEVWQRFAGKWATCSSGLAEIHVKIGHSRA
jgi:outer membrane murein-binding lipoprotein Lpp